MSGRAAVKQPGASAPSRGRRSPRARTSQALVIVGLLVLWYLLDAARVVSEQALAGPIPVFTRTFELLMRSATWVEISQTLSVWGLGLLVSVCVAVPVGLFLGSRPFAYRSSRFIIDFLRTIPPLGIIPLIALMYGGTQQTKLTIVILACIWPLLLQSVYGVRSVDPAALEMARSFRLGRARTATAIVLPSTMPYIATGLRIAATLGMLLAISIELLLLVPGVGNGLARAQGNGETADVYAYTIVSAMLGLAVMLCFGRLERTLIRWHPSQRSRS